MIFNVFIPVGTIYSDHPVILDNPKFFKLHDRTMNTITKEEIDDLKIEVKEGEMLEVRGFYIPFMTKMLETNPHLKEVIESNVKTLSSIATKFNGSIKVEFIIADLIETTTTLDNGSTFLVGYSINLRMVNFPLKSIKNFLLECYKLYTNYGIIINLYDEAIIKPLNKLIGKSKVMIHTSSSKFYKYNEYDKQKEEEAKKDSSGEK